MKEQTTKTQTTTTKRDYYADAEKAVYIALRARHEKSGLQFLADLQNAWSNDQTARQAPQTAERIHDLEQLHESHRKGADYFQCVANRLKVTAEERAVAQSLAEDFKRKATTEQAEIDTLYDILNLTYSDRADLVQTACLKMLEVEQQPAPITAGILATYGAETEEDLTEEEREQAQASANFRAVINAVGRAVNTLATPEALNSTTTKAVQITAEEYRELLEQWGTVSEDNEPTLDGVKIPHTTKRTRASDCYITIEHRDTKTQQGWYKVTHYRTTAPYQYIDAYTEDENGETDVAYLKTYNPFVSNTADLERIEDLCKRANLTDRQRTFLEHFARACRFEGDFKKCKEHAFRAIGITTTTAQTSFFHRLKKALNTAK